MIGCYDRATALAFSRGPTGTGPVETCSFRVRYLVFNRAPTDTGSVESTACT